MFKIVIVLSVIIATVFGGTELNDTKTRIKRVVNGTKTEITSHNYYVYLKFDTRFCGGTLIKEDLVLTAAHCFKNISVTDIRVLVNMRHLNDPYVKTYKVSWYKIHPEFKSVPYNDVGVIKLKRKVGETRVIKISPKSPEIDDFVRIIGYGYVGCTANYFGDCTPKYTNNLQTTVTKVLRYSVDDVMVTYKSGTSACFGDSGSAVLSTGKLVGLISAVRPLCDGANSIATIAKDTDIYKSFIKQFM